MLTACAGTTTPIVQTQLNQIDVPPAQRQCPALPVPPDPDDPATTQKVVALYIADLLSVVEHCKYDLITLNKIIDDYNALAAKLNEEQAASQ